MNKTVIVMCVVVALVGGGAFYAGVKYGEKNPSAGGQRGQSSRMGLQNLSPEEREQRIQQFGAGTGGFRNAALGGAERGGFVTGEVIAKDGNSVTVKLDGGGSKILFASASTSVTSVTAGAFQDLVVGMRVAANGASNADGSVTARTIQIVPPQDEPRLR